jgi:hypothetical protein
MGSAASERFFLLEGFPLRQQNIVFVDDCYCDGLILRTVVVLFLYML